MRKKLNYRILLSYFIYSLFVYSWLSMNIILPVLPYWIQEFHTNTFHASLTMSAFLFIFAVMQLAWGPLSDKFGRRICLLWGISFTILGAFLSAISPGIDFLIVARIIEAFGMAAGTVIARAIIMDYFDVLDKTKLIAQAAMISATLPVIGSLLGGQLFALLGWRAIFIFLTVCGCLLLYFTKYLLQETNVSPDKMLTAKRTMNAYVYCLKNKRFVGALAMYGIFYGVMVGGYYSVAPFIYINHLHASPRYYGFVLIFTVACYMLGAFVVRSLVKKVSFDAFIIIGIIFSTIAFLSMIFFNYFYGLSWISIILPMMFFIIGAGIISPVANTIGMSLEENKGSAAALLGCVMAGAAALFSAIMTCFNMDTLLPLIGLLGIVSVTNIVIYKWLL